MSLETKIALTFLLQIRPGIAGTSKVSQVCQVPQSLNTMYTTVITLHIVPTN